MLAQNDPSSSETWDDYEYYNQNNNDDKEKGDKLETGFTVKKSDAKVFEKTTEQNMESDQVKAVD